MKKKLIGYVIANSLEQRDDTITLYSNKIFFNKADAAEKAGGRLIFQLVLHYPQNGNGSL